MSAVRRPKPDDTVQLPVTAANPYAAPPGASSVAPGASIRVHIEAVNGSYHRPELPSSSPGRTVFDGAGSRQLMAEVLRRVARQLDPPWWRRCLTRR